MIRVQLSTTADAAWRAVERAIVGAIATLGPCPRRVTATSAMDVSRKDRLNPCQKLQRCEFVGKKRSCSRK